MESEYIVVSPLSVVLPRKTKKDKNFILNLSIYRNTHYQILNQAKIYYKNAMKTQISGLPVFDKIKLTLVLYTKTKRLTDIDNVLSIHAKFLLDALVELGRLPDDNYLYVPEICFRFGGVDKENARVDVVINNI